MLISSGVVANLELGERLEILLSFPPFPLPHLPSLPTPSLPILSPRFFSFFFPLSSFLASSYGFGEPCKLLQQDLGWSLSWSWALCILVLKYDIWWQQLQWFSWESTYHRLCISLQAYLGDLLLYHPSPLSWYYLGERCSPKKYSGNGIPPCFPSTTPLLISPITWLVTCTSTQLWVGITVSALWMSPTIDHELYG